MNHKQEKMETYFSQKTALCAERYCALWEDSRADDAAFQKVQANVYEIFRTVLSVCVKTKGDEPYLVKAMFLEKMGQITGSWAQASALARTHDDQKRLCIEEIKLNVAREIQEVFLATWEGEQ